jgi:hypothetical protein
MRLSPNPTSLPLLECGTGPRHGKAYMGCGRKIVQCGCRLRSTADCLESIAWDDSSREWEYIDMGGGYSIAHRPPHAGTLPLDTRWSYVHLAGSLSLKGASVAVAFALLRRLPPLIETLRLQRSIGPWKSPLSVQSLLNST